MAKQITLQEVKARMKEMQETKAAELATIQKKQEEARAQIEAAGLAIKSATERTDLEAYEEAKAQKRKAQTALDMYDGRYDQIRKQEYISEAESDKVIDSLLAYEMQLEVEFKEAVGERLRELSKILEDYRTEVQATEDTISAWCRNIHANYNTRGMSTRIDKVTGQLTDRSEKPIPVHVMPYNGCGEAAQLGDYLKQAAPLMKA